MHVATLLHKLGERVKGVIEGFDRIVFKGILRPICYAAGMSLYLSYNKVLNKDYKDWITDKSATIIRDAEDYALQQSGTPIIYLSSSTTRKETVAHEKQKENGIQSGLIGAWSCVEACNTFKAVYDRESGFPQLRSNSSRCKHIYFYFDHEEYGFMSIRLQTWAPFEIQIALNGREWLKRQLDKAGVGYDLCGNKFIHIDNYDIAQSLLNDQVFTRWIDMLAGFVPNVFPSMTSILGDNMSYTWTLWQSEWARDYIFTDMATLNAYMPHLLRHAVITGTSDRVLRYLGHPVCADGMPRLNANPEVSSRANCWYDGARVRHWVGKNSVKVYNELNVLRIEFTMNDPTRYRINRLAEGSLSDEKKLMPLRKGIADIAPRTKVCSQRIDCFSKQLAAMEEDLTVEELLSQISKSIMKGGRPFRGLEVTGKDMDLLKAIADPRFSVDAITNKYLRESLAGSSWANGLTGKSLSARVSRNLRLLREHGIIKKLPKQNKYMLTDKGRLLTTAINQFLGAKISDLSRLAA
jgi:hypothetical protein